MRMVLNLEEENNHTILIDSNEKAHNGRGYYWESYFKKNTDASVKFATLPAGDILYKNKKGRLIGVEYKEGIDLTISQDSKHLHKQIDKLQMYDKKCVVATEGYRKDYPHNNYWVKLAYKNIHFIPCITLEDATDEIFNFFKYGDREGWLPESRPSYSCKMGALACIPKGLSIGEKTINKLYVGYPTLDDLLAEDDFSKIDGIGEKTSAIIYDCLHKT